mmetsp:Transcript_103049/g.204564  ORF Transcript_103049/g.204564 Transcript_103049/m.204564 type:complete len:341 (+) Transcript_103049:53-1075(+)
MPKAPPRKPPGATGDSYWRVLGRHVWKGARQALVIAAILGASQLAGYLRKRGSGESDTAVPNAPAVLVLGNESSFSEALASHPEGIVVNFHSAGCKFCTKLAPHYEVAARELREGGPILASLDSEDGGAMLEKLNVDRYPTVLWLWRGERAAELARASEKSAADIVKWARWLLTPAVQDLEARSEFLEALPDLRGSLHESRHLFVAFNRTDSAGLRDAIENVAQRHRQRNVFLFIGEAASNGTLLKAYGPDEALDLDYNGTAEPKEVLAWVTGIVEQAVVAELKSKVEAKKKQLEELQAEAALQRKAASEGGNNSNITAEPLASASEPTAAAPSAGSEEL